MMLIDTGINIDNTPMKATAFYKWLNKDNIDPVTYTNIRHWLQETFGFEDGIDTISSEQNTALHWIHDYWFRINMGRD